MSTPQPPDVDNGETQIESQDLETQNEETQEFTIPDAPGEDGEAPAAPAPKKKRVRKEPMVLTREPGKSLLPFSRVQKIIKADKDIPIVAKDATYLISLATEEFIQRLCEASYRVSEREKRTMIQHKDIATVVRKADEFLFLEEIIPWTAPDPVAKRGKPKGGKGDGLQAAPTMLDQFMFGAKSGGDKAVGEEEVEDLTQRDIVMNEDGTMYAAGGETEHDEFA